MKFEDVNINKGLYQALQDMELDTMSEIQARSFSSIMSGKDFIGIAQTGTGKTIAYLLPLLRMYQYEKKKEPKVLILVPTRELVLQVLQTIQELGSYLSARAFGVFGGVNINTQRLRIAEGYDIIIGTPGRTMDLLLDGTINPKRIKKLVIDEYDEMLNEGFRIQLGTILDLLPKKKQVLLFSATRSETMEALAEDFMLNPAIVVVKPEIKVLPQIAQFGYYADNFNSKFDLLRTIWDASFEKVLIFTKSKHVADLLFERFNVHGFEKVDHIHSNKSQNYRIRVIESYREGALDTLITTDLMARGIDVPDITHVINFDLPQDVESYIHRMGRTGRFDRSGILIDFINEKDRLFHSQLNEALEERIVFPDVPEEYVPSEEYLEFELIEIKGGDKAYYVPTKLKHSQGAYHEKKAKNKKVNLGSAYWRKQKAKKGNKRRS